MKSDAAKCVEVYFEVTFSSTARRCPEGSTQLRSVTGLHLPRTVAVSRTRHPGALRLTSEIALCPSLHRCEPTPPCTSQRSTRLPQHRRSRQGRPASSPSVA